MAEAELRALADKLYALCRRRQQYGNLGALHVRVQVLRTEASDLLARWGAMHGTGMEWHQI
jgi:hypothetical protein